MTPPSYAARLHSLARLHGIQTSYFNVQCVRVRPPDDTITALLASMGMKANCSSDCEESLRETALRQWSRPIEPVIVAWDGLLPPFEYRTSGDSGPARTFTITTDSGTTMRVDSHAVRTQEQGARNIGGLTVRSYRVDTGIRLPSGYHRLSVKSGDTRSETLIISAPRKGYREAPNGRDRWGCFAPLYALRTKRDWGAGTYTSLETLAQWIHSQGGSLLGTLPLLPAFHEAQDNPSPYLPMTRLLWGEFYVDVENIPFLKDCPTARSLLESAAFQDECKLLRASSLVEYHRVEHLKQQILTPLALHVRAQAGTAHHELQRFLQTHPLVSDYAAFRAALIREGRTSWHEWPARMHNGDISP